MSWRVKSRTRRLRRPTPGRRRRLTRRESQKNILQCMAARNPLKRLVSDERIQASPKDTDKSKQGFSGVGAPGARLPEEIQISRQRYRLLVSNSALRPRRGRPPQQVLPKNERSGRGHRRPSLCCRISASLTGLTQDGCGCAETTRRIFHGPSPSTAAQDPCDHGASAVRAHRARLAGRRRAGRLSGRRLPGARRGEASPRLDSRHFDRRSEFGPDRRKCAGEAGRSLARVLGNRERRPARHPQLCAPRESRARTSTRRSTRCTHLAF